MEKETTKTKNILRNLKEKPLVIMDILDDLAMATALPVAMLVDFFRANVCRVLNEKDNITAAHESGHLILDLFNEKKVKNFWMSPLRENTTNTLFSTVGAVVFDQPSMNTIEFTRLWRDFKKLISIYPEEENDGFLYNTDVQKAKVSQNAKVLVQSTYELLGGTVGDYIISHSNEQREKSEGEKIRFFYDRISKGSSSDAKKALKQFDLGKNHERVPIKFLKKAFLLLIDFFSEPQVKKIIEIFAFELLTKQHLKANGEESLNEELIDLLEENGISRKEFKALKRKYFEYVSMGINELRNLLQTKIPEDKKTETNIISDIQEEEHSDYIDRMGKFF